MEDAPIDNSDLSQFQTTVKNDIRSGIKKRTFDGGNGDKILKRLLGLAGQLGAKLGTSELRAIILERPGVRQSAFKYMSLTGTTPGRLKALTECATSGYFVDDAALVDLCNSVVETKITKTAKRDPELIRLIDACDVNSYFGLYGKLWLQSKYGATSALLATISSNRNRWSPHEHLGRLIGAFSPLFSEGEREEYIGLLIRSCNSGFRSVLQFHNQLSTRGAAFKAMFPALRVPNQTRGTGITHSKFLCLLSALRNPEASNDQTRLLREANSGVLQDAYYRRLVRTSGVPWEPMNA